MTTTSRPLQGKVVLVTRASGQAGETATMLRARGATPLEVATIAIEPPDDRSALLAAARTLGAHDVIALTSVNAVEALFSALDELGVGVGAFGASLVAAIGPSTARALRRRGVRIDVMPSEHRGEALAVAILEALDARDAPRHGARVLLPRAAIAREALPAALRAQGVNVDEVIAYRTCPPDPARIAALSEMLARRAVDVILFTSSSTVDNLCDVVPVASFSHATIATLGPLTSATCRARGVRVDVEASPFTLEAMLDALEAYFTREN